MQEFLAAQPRWVLWRPVERNGRQTKEPSRVIGAGRASSTNPKDWAPFPQADRVFRSAPNRWSGLGIVLGELEGGVEYLAGIDLDQCLDDGAMAAWAEPFIGLLDSYAEVSPSGEGVKAFFRIARCDLPAFRHALGLRDDEWGRKRTYGATPAHGGHAPAAELYISRRYFTVTGIQIPESPDEVALLSPDALARLAEMMGPRAGEARSTDWTKRADNDDGADEGAVDDEALRAKLEAALQRSPKLRARWGGSLDGLSDATKSGFDMSLGAMLKARGFSFAEMKAALIACRHGAGAERATDTRYFERIWSRTAAERPDQAQHETDDDEKQGPPPRDAAAGFELTEDGVALGFAAAAEGRFVFDHTSQQWFRWDGGRWALDAKAGAFHQVRLFCRKVRERQPEPPKAMAKIAFTSNVERAARTDPRLAVSHEDWDRDRWLLGVPGGVIDLRTGEHRPGDPKNFIRRQTAVAPAAPGTTAPLWFAFLKDVTRDDADLQGFLQRLAGYVLTGDVSEEVLTFLYGPGGNGKGVFLGAIVSILADYAVSVPIEVFVANSRLNLEYYRARMVGARLVTASETEAGATWSESLIKELTGNEAPLSARDPYGKPFTFLPHFKLCLVGNHAPRLKGRTPAMERRLRVVPFTNEPAQPDPELKDKLRAEYPAILRWMLDGCGQWRAKRLGTSKAISEATSAYFQQQDGFRRWMEECCHLNPDFSDRPGALFADFTAWARDNGEAPVSSGEFREMVERTKGLRYVANKGTRYVRGIALKPQAERNPPPLKAGDEDESCAA